VRPESDWQESNHDRIYDRATTSGEGRRSFAVVAFAVSVFMLLSSVSCRQITAIGPAKNVLESGLVTVTDIDQFIADEGPALRQFARESDEPTIIIPGYPLDVVLNRDDVIKSSDAQLRAIILERSAALVYAEGLDAFDRTGKQSIRRVSLQGLLELAVEQISGSNHTRANVLAALSLLALTVFGAITLATAQGWGRMRALGLAVVAGSLPVLVLSYLLRLFVGAVGGDDPFVASLRDISKTTLSVPIRNSLIVLVAGVLLTAMSVVLARVDRMSSPAPEPAEDDW
jgi:hypothetical protein